MGNKTSGPNTDKKIYTGSNSKFSYICCEMQGWRNYMVKNKIYFLGRRILMHYK
jgi:hypothetical protein